MDALHFSHVLNQSGLDTGNTLNDTVRTDSYSYQFEAFLFTSNCITVFLCLYLLQSVYFTMVVSQISE